MSVVGEALRQLMALGVEGEPLVAAIERIVAATQEEGARNLREAVELAASRADEALAHRRLAGRQRQARYDAKKRQMTSDDVNDCHGVSPKEIPPRPPKEITPSPNPSDHPLDGLAPAKILKFAKPSGFDRFWEAYPRKVGKGAARKSFERSLAKLAHHAEPLAVLLAAVARARQAWDDPEFIPHPATWLNQERWDDEPELPPPQTAAWESGLRSVPMVSRETLTDEELLARIAKEAEELDAQGIH